MTVRHSEWRVFRACSKVMWRGTVASAASRPAQALSGTFQTSPTLGMHTALFIAVQHKCRRRDIAIILIEGILKDDIECGLRRACTCTSLSASHGVEQQVMPW